MFTYIYTVYYISVLLSGRRSNGLYFAVDSQKGGLHNSTIDIFPWVYDSGKPLVFTTSLPRQNATDNNLYQNCSSVPADYR